MGALLVANFGEETALGAVVLDEEAFTGGLEVEGLFFVVAGAVAVAYP